MRKAPAFADTYIKEEINMMTMMPSIFGDDVFDSFFDGFARPQVKRERPRRPEIMKTDVKEMEEDYEIIIDLPGVKKEDVKAELKNGTLTVNASYGSENTEKDETNGKFIRHERFCGAASRSFYVGNQVKQEDIRARFDNGVLTLSVPKACKYEAVEENNYIAIEG